MLVLDCPIPEQHWRDEVERDSFLAEPPDAAAADAVPDAGAWEPAVQTIVGFQHLGDDWDGFGAEAPSRELLESAIGLAYVFKENGVPPPNRVAPGVEGSVILEWQFPDGDHGLVEVVRPL